MPHPNTSNPSPLHPVSVSSSDGKPLRIEHYVLLAAFASISLAVSFDINDSTLLKEAMFFLGSLILVGIPLVRTLKEAKVSFALSPLQILLAAYILVCGISIAGSFNKRLGVEYLLRLSCFFVVLTTAGGLAAEHRKFDRLIARTITVVTLICCTIGFFQILPDARFGILPLTAVREMVSTFGNRAYFAGFLVLAAPILLSSAVSNGSSRGERLLHFGTTLMALFCILKTESRSAWIAILAALVLFCWLNYRTAKARLIMFSCIFILAASGSIVFSDIVSHRFQSIFDTTPSSSVYRRIFFYEGAWNAFLASPLIGHGAGNFSLVLPKYRPPDYWMAHSEDIVPHAHSEILEVLSETGLAGLICIALMAIVFVRIMRTTLRSSSENHRTLLIGYMCALFAVCIDNLTDMTLRTIPVAFSFWMVVGLALRGTSRIFDGGTLTLPQWTRRLWLLPIIIAVAATVMYAPKLTSRYDAEKAFLQGLILRAAGETSASTEKFATTLANDPAHPMARLFIASNLAAKADFQQARDHITLLLREYPFYPKARIILATSLFALGDTMTALQTIRDELAIETSPQAMYIAAYIAHGAGQTSDETRFLQTLLANAQRGGEREYVREALQEFSQRCRADQTAAMYRELVHHVAERFWSDVKIISAAGGFLADNGLLEDSKKMLLRAYELDPQSEEIKRNLRFIQEEITRNRKTEPEYH